MNCLKTGENGGQPEDSGGMSGGSCSHRGSLSLYSVNAWSTFSRCGFGKLFGGRNLMTFITSDNRTIL